MISSYNFPFGIPVPTQSHFCACLVLGSLLAPISQDLGLGISALQQRRGPQACSSGQEMGVVLGDLELVAGQV